MFIEAPGWIIKQILEQGLARGRGGRIQIAKALATGRPGSDDTNGPDPNRIGLHSWGSYVI